MLAEFGLVETRAQAIRVGDIFGRLTVVAVGQVPDTYRYKAVCQCSCGSPLKAVRFDGLLKGSVVACGCVRLERTTTHGQHNSPHYDRWRHMMDRCYNPDCKAYPDYGGRGIKVTERWHDLATFVAEVPAGFFGGAEIDRIDNDGDYEPSNVRWVTPQRNAGNRRSARLIEFNGRTQSITEWAVETGISISALSIRLDRLGWPIDRALTEPMIDAVAAVARGRAKRWAGHVKKVAPEPRVPVTVEYQGREMTVAELSALTGIGAKLLRKRILERGWTVDRAATTPA